MQLSPSEQIQYIARQIKDSLQKKIVKRTLTKTAKSLKSELTRDIRKQVPIKAKDLRRRIYNRKAKKVDNAGSMKSSVAVYPSGIPLIMLGAKRKRVTTTAGRRVGAAIGGRIIPGGFITSSRAGRRAVFARSRNARLPIRQLYSSAVSDYLEKRSTIRSIEAFITKRFLTIYQQEFKFEMGKLKK